MTDVKKVNAAVKIKISLERRAKKRGLDGVLEIKQQVKRRNELFADLIRLTKAMTNEEYNEYLKRVQ